MAAKKKKTFIVKFTKTTTGEIEVDATDATKAEKLALKELKEGNVCWNDNDEIVEVTDVDEKDEDTDEDDK